MQQKNVLIFLCLLVSTLLLGQSPYKTNWKNEIPYVATGAITLGIGLFAQSNTTVLTTMDINLLDAANINRFDRKTVNQYDTKAERLSDVFLYSSFAAQFALAIGKPSRTELPKLVLLWGETAFINGGITILTKYSTRRIRPFVYNADIAFAKKTELTAQASFFSGHTSATAANTFFLAKVFSDYYPDSKWKPVVWGTAATIPAVTAYLRVAGGKHFPTDVITGYLVGGVIGILVPHLHKGNRRVRLKMGVEEIGLVWRLD